MGTKLGMGLGLRESCRGAHGSGGPPPEAPVAGYAAWFKVGGAYCFADVLGLVPATDGLPVLRWDSAGGTYGALSLTIPPGGFGAPTYRAAAANGLDVLEFDPATFTLMRDAAQSATIFESGILSSAAGTVMCVAAPASADNRALWGDNGAYLLHEFRSGPVAIANLYDGASATASQPAALSRSVLTWHHQAGVLYSGVNDSRTDEMASAAAASLDAGAGWLVVGGAAGPGRYFHGPLCEMVFYNSALSEADRVLTERYLAARWDVALAH